MGVQEIEKKGVGNITLYTLTHCLYCNTLKKALNHLNVPFREIDVDENEYMGDWIERNYKNEGYPVINFTKRPGEEIYILPDSNLENMGSNRIFTTIEEALEILLEFYYEI